MDAGETFLVRHLWVVVSDPHKNPDEVLLVNLTSVKQGVFCDDACMVDVGDHPFVTTKSFLYYREAKVESNTALERRISANPSILREPVSAEFLKRIRDGARKSRFLQNRYKQLLRNQGLI